MQRILFVHNHPAPFVRLDLEILQRHFRVSEAFLRSRRVDPIAVWRQVRSHDCVVGWFASWHTFLPMLFARAMGRPSLLVVGGYDIANMPEIGYGHQRGGAARLVSRQTMSLASALVTNASYSRDEAHRNVGISAERIAVVYHGVPDLFGALPSSGTRAGALTVGNVDQANLWRKGHEPFVRTAALLPDVAFLLVGAWKDDAIEHLRAIATPNVTFAGRVSDDELLSHYSQASVYVQASAHEGFGLSVAEAMLGGCVPVVTRAGSLLEVVGPAGVYADSQEPAALAAAIGQGLSLPHRAREKARQRVLNCFPLAKREEQLVEVIHSLLDGRSTHHA